LKEDFDTLTDKKGRQDGADDTSHCQSQPPKEFVDPNASIAFIVADPTYI